MNLYAVMWQKGVNDWAVCTAMDGGIKRSCVHPTRKAAELELKNWLESCGPDDYKVAKLDVVVLE